MIEFIMSGDNLPFTVSVGIMLAIALLEGVGMIVGVGLSNLLDNIFPDTDGDIDIPDEIETPNVLTKLWAWLRIGKVPIVVLMIAALTSFGICGYIIQSIAKSLLGGFLPWFVAVVPAVLITLPVIRISSNVLSKIIPGDETSAVSEDSFIGQIAIITIGVAKKGSPAEAKLTDKYGQSHYVMVEPDNEIDSFKQGEKVLLVKSEVSVFKVIQNPNQLLTD